MAFFKEVTSNYSSEQMRVLFNQAKQMGVPDEVITKIQDERTVSAIEK